MGRSRSDLHQSRAPLASQYEGVQDRESVGVRYKTRQKEDRQRARKAFYQRAGERSQSGLKRRRQHLLRPERLTFCLRPSTRNPTPRHSDQSLSSTIVHGCFFPSPADSRSLPQPFFVFRRSPWCFGIHPLSCLVLSRSLPSSSCTSRPPVSFFI